jgi:hypothetical protein
MSNEQIMFFALLATVDSLVIILSVMAVCNYLEEIASALRRITNMGGK